MLIYVKCVGFFGAEIVGFVLTLPWYMLQVLWFVFSPYIFVGLPLALLLWGPLVFPIVYWAELPSVFSLPTGGVYATCFFSC